MRRACLAVAACAVLMMPVRAARAQSVTVLPHAPSAARVEVGVGGTWQGSVPLGGGSAALTPNLNGASYALFDARAAFGPAVGGEVRVSFRLTPWLLAGLMAGQGAGTVEVSIAGEQEGAPTSTLAGTRIRQSTVEARVDVLLLPLRTLGGRLTPFLSASGGILRHWPADRVVVESGHVLRAGVGARIGWPGPRGSWRSRTGLALEAGGSQVTGGVHWGERTRFVAGVRADVFTGWGR